MATNQPMIIGLYSPVPGSGKTTLATFMEESFGFERLSFATPIKSMVHTLCLWSRYEGDCNEFLMPQNKETPIPSLNYKSVRELCQSLGVDWAKTHLGEDIWVQILFERASYDKPIIIDDVRFPIEYEAIKARGGRVCQIIRPTATLPNSHPSEGLLEDRLFDRVLYNKGTKQEFYQQILKGVK